MRAGARVNRLLTLRTSRLIIANFAVKGFRVREGRETKAFNR
jgi:hypothetical protein